MIRGSDDDYRDSPPGAADVTCVIEVADNSLPRDLGVKLRAYARAGIEQFVVIDLVHDLAIDHRGPRGDSYEDVRSLRAGETLQLGAAGTQSVPVSVDRLLP